MVSAIAASYINTAALLARQSATGTGTDDTNRSKNTPAAQTTSETITDIISLSPQAIAALEGAKSNSVDYFSQFLPTRDGEPATALALAITNPGAESFSEGKTLEEVATAARASMDAKYTQMEEDGEPYAYNSFEGRDQNTLMADFDRRALYAVSSNEGGAFTQKEQEAATYIMRQQRVLAMGLYHGPTSQIDKFTDPYGKDHAARYKAGTQWLDNVSNDEKSSIAWASQRAGTQASYEAQTLRRGDIPENLDSKNPLVKLLSEALHAKLDNFERLHIVGANNATADDLKDKPWLEGFESRLDAVIKEAQDFYQSAEIETLI